MTRASSGGVLLPVTLPSEILRADYEGASAAVMDIGTNFTLASAPTVDTGDYPAITGKTQSFVRATNLTPCYSSVVSDANLTDGDYYAEFWIKNTDLAQTKYWWGNYTSTSDWAWSLGAAGTDLQLIWAEGAQSQSSGLVMTGGWDHVIVQHDVSETTLTFGLNGTLAHFDTSGYTSWPDATKTYMGIFGNRQSIGWVGKIGGFRVGTAAQMPTDALKYRVPTELWS